MSGEFSKNVVFFCMKIVNNFTNSVDPDEMQHYAAFHLGLHCLPKYLFRGFPEYKGLRVLTMSRLMRFFVLIVFASNKGYVIHFSEICNAL